MFKKRIVKVLLTLCFLFIFPLSFRADAVSDVSDRIRDLTDARRLYDAIPPSVSDLFFDVGFDPESETQPIFPLVFAGVKSVFVSVFEAHRGLFFTGIALILLFRLMAVFPTGDPALGDGLCFLTAAASGIYTFTSAQALFDDLQSVAAQISEFLTAALPVLVSAQTLAGRSEEAAALSFAVPLILQAVTVLIRSVFYPLCLFCFAASLTGFYRGSITLRPLVGGVRRFSTRGAELLSLLTVGVAALMRLSAASGDRVMQKTVRFAVSNLIPVAGASLSEGLETVYICASSFSARAGIVAVLSAAVMFLAPCAACLFFTLLYGLLGSLAQSFGVASLADLYGAWKDLFSILAAFSLCAVTVLCVTLTLMTGG